MIIKSGSKVTINYTLRVDGKVVDTSEGGTPLTFTQGSGDIIPGLDERIVGLKIGDKKKISVSPENAYGERNPLAIQKVPIKAFKDPNELKVGSIVGGNVGDKEFQAVVTEVNEKEVTLDLNHPLAGKSLDFDIEIVNIQ